MGIDVLDIVATILAVWFSVRKLDAQSRRAEDFPHVARLDFEAWQSREVDAYRVAAFGCVLKVIVDLIFTLVVVPCVSFGLARAGGGIIDLSWAALLVATFVRTHRARETRRRLGIHLGVRPPRPGENPYEENTPVELEERD